MQRRVRQWPRARVGGGPHQRHADPFLLGFATHYPPFAHATPQTWRQPSRTLPRRNSQPAALPVLPNPF